MSEATLEERLARLESLVEQQSRRRGKDWRRTIGMFDGDPVMQEIIDGALLARAEERRQVREQDRGRAT